MPIGEPRDLARRSPFRIGFSSGAYEPRARDRAGGERRKSQALRPMRERPVLLRVACVPDSLMTLSPPRPPRTGRLFRRDR